MAKKIAWEYYNPKEVLQDIINEQYDLYGDDEDDFQSDVAQKPPKIADNPFAPIDYWIGHTNFKLTAKHFEDLNHKSMGLEHFRILSPYRLVVIPAKMFEWSDVRLSLEKLLCDKHITYTNNLNVDNKIETLKNTLTEYKYWVILVLPNGELCSFKSNIYDNNFVLKYQELIKLKENSNAIIIESDLCKNNKV